MAALLRGRLPSLAIGGIAGGGLTAASVSSPSFYDLFPLAPLKQLIQAVAAPTSEAAANAIAKADAHAAALAASVRAIEQLLQQQRNGRSLRGMLWLALPAAGFAAYAYYAGWWGAFGWVTPVKFEAGLLRVQEKLSACVSSLGDTLLGRFATVEEQNAALVCSVEDVKAELTAEVHTVGESVAALEARFAPIEADVHRTAEGVGLLCEVVAGLSNNASPDLMRRLGNYTGGEAALPAPPAPRTPPRAELLPPAVAHTLSAPAGGGSLKTTGFMRALLEPVPSQ